ncbi:hypothetical protein [Bradyrhizobium sp. UFLA05-112]
MIVECSPDRGIRLTEPLDFSGFKLVLRGALGVPPRLGGITVVDQDNALVPIDLVPNLPGRPNDNRDWDVAYSQMVDRARERGWIDLKVNAIRAHIERVV